MQKPNHGKLERRKRYPTRKGLQLAKHKEEEWEAEEIPYQGSFTSPPACIRAKSTKQPPRRSISPLLFTAGGQSPGLTPFAVMVHHKEGREVKPRSPRLHNPSRVATLWREKQRDFPRSLGKREQFPVSPLVSFVGVGALGGKGFLESSLASSRTNSKPPVSEQKKRAKMSTSKEEQPTRDREKKKSVPLEGKKTKKTTLT